jgi:hypothetical protein
LHEQSVSRLEPGPTSAAAFFVPAGHLSRFVAVLGLEDSGFLDVKLRYAFASGAAEGGESRCSDATKLTDF